MGLRIDPNARFEREAKRAKQEENARQQQVREAIARKFAAQGMQGAGAEIKVTREAQDVGAQRTDQRLDEIASRQEAAALQRQEIKDAREFARQERMAGEKFAAEQARLGREMQASQFEKQFGMQKEQFQKQYDLQFSQFNWQKGLSKEQTQMAKDAAKLAQEQFDFQKQTENYNAVQSIINQSLPPGATLKPEHVDALLGIMGPEILGAFPNLKEMIAGIQGGGGGGGGGAPSSGQYTFERTQGRGGVPQGTINGTPVFFEPGSGRNPIYRDAQGNRYQQNNGQWVRI